MSESAEQVGSAFLGRPSVDLVPPDDLTEFRDHCRAAARRCTAGAYAGDNAGDLRRVFDLITAATAWKRLADQIDAWLDGSLDDASRQPLPNHRAPRRGEAVPGPGLCRPSVPVRRY